MAFTRNSTPISIVSSVTILSWWKDTKLITSHHFFISTQITFTSIFFIDNNVLIFLLMSLCIIRNWDAFQFIIYTFKHI